MIPLFNKGPYIRRAISSVLNQTIQEFEIIVIDDGSIDDSIEIVKQIKDERIGLIKQDHHGVSVARNRGIHEARADLIAFLDADDEWKAEFIETILRLSSNYPHAGAYATSYDILSPDGKVRTPKISGLPMVSSWEGIIQNYFQTAFNEPPFFTSSIAILKIAFNEVGGFKEGIKLGEDLDMWLRIALTYPIAFSNSLQVIYHQEAKNRACLTHQYHDEVPFAHTARQFFNNEEFDPDFKTDIYEYVAKYQIFAASHCLKNGNREKASKILSSVKDTRRFRIQWLWWSLMLNLPAGVFRSMWTSYRYLKSRIFQIK